MDTVFPIVGLCVLALSVAQIVRLMAGSGIRAFQSWRTVARHTMRARQAEASARAARAALVTRRSAGECELARAVRATRDQTGREASATSSLRRTSS